MANKKIKITKSLWGKFSLPYNVGQTVSLESKQADEIVESGHAREVVKAKAKTASSKK